MLSKLSQTQLDLWPLFICRLQVLSIWMCKGLALPDDTWKDMHTPIQLNLIEFDFEKLENILGKGEMLGAVCQYFQKPLSVQPYLLFIVITRVFIRALWPKIGLKIFWDKEKQYTFILCSSIFGQDECFQK